MGIPFESDIPTNVGSTAQQKCNHLCNFGNNRSHEHANNNNNGLKLEIQEFVGNHKEFRIETNIIHLRIIGNNNRVILKYNYGKLDVIGHATKVKIHTNCGKINYVGNNGKIYLGRRSAITNVHYTGNQGSVKLLDTGDLIQNNTIHRSNSSNNLNKSTEVTNTNRNSLPPISSSSSSSSTSTSNNNQPPTIVLIDVKNNISLPNIDELTNATNQTLNAQTTFKISNNSTDICVNNFFRKRNT